MKVSQSRNVLLFQQRVKVFVGFFIEKSKEHFFSVHLAKDSELNDFIRREKKR